MLLIVLFKILNGWFRQCNLGRSFYLLIQRRAVLLRVREKILNGQHGRLIILAAFEDYDPSICLIVFTQEKK